MVPSPFSPSTAVRAVDELNIIVLTLVEVLSAWLLSLETDITAYSTIINLLKGLRRQGFEAQGVDSDSLESEIRAWYRKS